MECCASEDNQSEVARPAGKKGAHFILLGEHLLREIALIILLRLLFAKSSASLDPEIQGLRPHDYWQKTFTLILKMVLYCARSSRYMVVRRLVTLVPAW